MTDEPKGYVIWADGPPPDELRDGQDVLLGNEHGSAVGQWRKDRWWCGLAHWLGDDDVDRHARLE